METGETVEAVADRVEDQRLRAALLDAVQQAVVAIDPEGQVIYWNHGAERVYGWTAALAVGRPATALVSREQPAAEALAVMEGLRRGQGWSGGYWVRRADGQRRHVEVVATPMLDPDGGLAAVIEVSTETGAGMVRDEAHRQLAEAQRIAHIGSFELDPATDESTWSDELYRIFGLEPGLPTAGLLAQVLHPHDVARVRAARTEATQEGRDFDLVYRVVRPDGDVRWVHGRAVTEGATPAAAAKLIGTLTDITDRMEADRIRRAAESRFEIGFEQAGIGAAVMDLDGVATRVNAAVCRFLGRTEDELVGGDWADWHHPDDVALGPAVMARLADGHDTFAAERRFVRPDGTTVWGLLNLTMVRDEIADPQYYLAQLQDITEQKQAEHELLDQALHDSLTGLPNRALLNDRLLHGLAGNRRRGTRLGVMFLDIDRFKVVNDSLGHSFGDALLRRAADRISRSVRASDTVARFGGDEFVIVCDDITRPDLEAIAHDVLAVLGQTCTLGDQELNLTASVGLVVAADDATPESLLRDSDVAMHRAKERGRGRVESFDQALRVKVDRRLATESALHRALDRGELTVHYQPVVDLLTGAMVSAEALLRWEHPVDGLIRPDEFVPLAEETGLIVPIGAWVLEQACQRLARWQRSAPSMSVAVNVSVRQIGPDLVAQVEEVCRRSGVRPADLCLEMTESVLMDTGDDYETTVAALKAVGVQLAIDDFGTGFSSLSYLKRFPVDIVKVDRSFVSGLGTDPNGTALVAAIIAMAAALDLEVVAEGIETAQQLTQLRAMGCRRAQGYYMARPMTAALMDWLVTRSQRWDVDDLTKGD